jgi:hypothetical protein
MLTVRTNEISFLWETYTSFLRRAKNYVNIKSTNVNMQQDQHEPKLNKWWMKAKHPKNKTKEPAAVKSNPYKYLMINKHNTYPMRYVLLPPSIKGRRKFVHKIRI